MRGTLALQGGEEVRSYAGWGSMTFLGGEAKQAHVNIRRGVIATITLLVIFFTFGKFNFKQELKVIRFQ